MLPERSMELLTMWGPLSALQIDVVTEGSLGLEELLAEVLAGE